MGRSRRRRRSRGCGPLLIVMVILAAGLAAGLYVTRYMPSNELADQRALFGVNDDQVALILNDQLQEAKGIRGDGQVYLPADWVKDTINERFYWDANEQLLIYTLPDSIVSIDAQTQGQEGPLLKVTENGAYLSLELVQTYTDLRSEVFASSQIKRVFLDTDWSGYDTAVLKRRGRLRVKGGVKSPVVVSVEKGSSVKLLETMDRWSRVRTDSGYIGYIQNRLLTDRTQVVPSSSFKAPVYTSLKMDEKVRLGFHQVTRAAGNHTLDAYASAAKGMNVIVPTWFNVISSEGEYTSYASKDYVDRAHDLGLQVWAMVENVSTEESVKNLDTKELMSYTSKRRKLIAALMKEAEQYGFDGFNLDFESLKAEAGPHYVQFIREMSVACRQKGLVLSIDNYVPSAYTAFYNRREQGAVADYVIIMAYDEHYAGGDAGSVSSLPYVKDGIANTLKEVPKDKVIISLPFYTRVWTEKDGKTTSKAYGIADAESWVKENRVELQWQEELGQYYGETSGEAGTQRIWMEEERSLGLKVQAVREADTAGVGCWKLGFETADIWDIVDEVN